MPSRTSSINDDAIDILPDIECNVLLDEFPTVMEQENEFNNCHLVKFQVERLCGDIKTDRAFSKYMEKEAITKNSRL